jgi:hypothetical protein
LIVPADRAVPGMIQRRPEWWNGRHGGLKIRCSKGRVGSTPTSGTAPAGQMHPGAVGPGQYDCKVPRGFRRLLVLFGLAGVLVAWRNRMLAANEAAAPKAVPSATTGEPY